MAFHESLRVTSERAAFPTTEFWWADLVELNLGPWPTLRVEDMAAVKLLADSGAWPQKWIEVFEFRLERRRFGLD